MKSSILSSIFLHFIIMMMAIVSLPIFNNPDLEIPPIIQIELIEILDFPLGLNPVIDFAMFLGIR